MNESAPGISVPSSLVLNKKRLDANFYSQDSIKARLKLDEIEESIEIKNMDFYNDDIFRPSIHKRNYTSIEDGDPYLTPTDVFMFPLKPRKYIKDYPEGLKVEPKWILLTCSGTVGRTKLVNKRHTNIVISQNMIRLMPKEKFFGLIYTYLNSWIGKTLVQKDEYGVTVKHINPEHVLDIPVPLFDNIVDKLNEKITNVFKLRNEAYELLQKAERLLYEDLDLPKVNKENASYLDENEKTFSTSSRFLDKRLDASYHVPWVRLVLEAMEKKEKEGLGKRKHLKNITKRRFVPPRFKRDYVDEPEKGLPMLQSSHIDQIQPQGVKFTSKKMKNLKKYIIHENWLLVTCSGKIGKTSLVSERWDGWSASNHMIRVIPNENKVHPGYLTIFLQSVYGQIQFERLAYGGVVDEIGESGELVDDIVVFKPEDQDLEEKIGSMVFEAYRKKDKANKLENEAVSSMENRTEELSPE